MSLGTEFSFDVTTADFEERVLRKSHELPVLVDFWATWCGPCQTLMPLLAKLAADYQGGFLLAKVETDAEPTLAQRFAIRSIPTVKLFRHGQVVEEFMGAQGERAIRALLDRHIVRESDKAIPAAQAALQAGRADDALALLDHALATDPGNVRLAIERARALVALQRYDEALQALKGLPSERRSQPDALALLNRIELARAIASAPPREELERRLANDPQDHEARYQFGVRCIVNDDYDAGLAALLEVVRHNRKLRDDAARKAILGAFTLLGSDHELVRKYRALLASALN
jgi:putative thioredoxin